MRIPLYSELENRVRTDLDLLDTDNFIGQDEMVGYCNEAIKDAEAEILKLSEDYLLTRAPISFVQGQYAIPLPTNIYAQKIREFIYQNGPLIYDIKRVRDPKRFYKRALSDYLPVGEPLYNYMLVSQLGAQDQIEITPPAQETGQVALLWYIRNANRVPLQNQGALRADQLSTPIDIPEWSDYLVQFMKVRCLDKMKDMGSLQVAMGILADRKKQMVDTLTQKTPDNDDTVAMDLDAYWEHS